MTQKKTMRARRTTGKGTDSPTATTARESVWASVPRTPIDEMESIAFDYYELLGSLIRDCEVIDKMIPRESARVPRAALASESDAIIIARKDDLLGYVQTICRDHIHWGKLLLEGGWTLKQRAEHRARTGRGHPMSPLTVSQMRKLARERSRK